jgi:hypothetical protein
VGRALWHMRIGLAVVLRFEKQLAVQLQIKHEPQILPPTIIPTGFTPRLPTAVVAAVVALLAAEANAPVALPPTGAFWMGFL